MPDCVFDILPIDLQPDPTRTIIRPFSPDDPADCAKPIPRQRRIADRIAALSDDAVARIRSELEEPLAARVADGEVRLRAQFEDVRRHFALPAFEEARAVVAGAYFSQEYAFESAALFNPSIVPHPDQSGAQPGGIHLLMALRGIGEGHISSVTFRRAHWVPGKSFEVDAPSARAVTPLVEKEEDDVVHFSWPKGTDPSEAVLFPATPSQRQGIEDMRLVNFVDGGTARLFATYTAFSGTDARSEMLEVSGSDRFTLRPITGRCARNKGMALFPRRIDGRYAMLGRIDNENLFLMRSDDPCHWDDADLLMEPREEWEIIQIGNCGSPIEIDEGWLVLTHGVGPVRSYSIGAALLDRDDPSRVLARSREPLLFPTPDERGGYVPNVVYSCGGVVLDRTMLLPYAVGDRYTAFATAPIDRILAALR